MSDELHVDVEPVAIDYRRECHNLRVLITSQLGLLRQSRGLATEERYEAYHALETTGELPVVHLASETASQVTVNMTDPDETRGLRHYEFDSGVGGMMREYAADGRLVCEMKLSDDALGYAALYGLFSVLFDCADDLRRTS